jgi:hypothetical protein
VTRLATIAAQLGVGFDGTVLTGPHTRCLLALALADMADHPTEAGTACIRLAFGDQ